MSSERAPATAEDIAALTAELGVELLPWQLEYARRAIAGERFVMQRGNRVGQKRLLQFLWAASDRFPPNSCDTPANGVANPANT